jgi:hypothetical protein
VWGSSRRIGTLSKTDHCDNLHVMWDFFQRINFRKGRVSAVSATARKLSVIIWNMVVKNIPYHNPHENLYLDPKRILGF